jgi:hypothetical protein
LEEVQACIPEPSSANWSTIDAFSLSVWDAMKNLKVQLNITHGENNA